MDMTVTARAVSVSKSLAAGSRLVLTDVSVHLAPRTVTALIGPNGAGKSTLLRALAGLESLTAGVVELGDTTPVGATTMKGIDTLSPLERARLVAWVPAGLDQALGFSVGETAVLGRYPWHGGRPTTADRRAAAAALEQMGVAALRDRPVDALSSGEQRKVAIARALAGSAPVLLLDEPCANLDIGAALQLLELLRGLATSGRTICLTLHDLPLAHRYADAGICLANGRVETQGPAATSLAPDVLGKVFGIRAAVAHTVDGQSGLVVST